MRDYQLIGLNWLADGYERHGLSPILGDEMGLGKTLQTIALLAHLKFDLKLAGAALVVCPLSVLSTWCAEVKRGSLGWYIYIWYTVCALFDELIIERVTLAPISIFFCAAGCVWSVPVRTPAHAAARSPGPGCTGARRAAPQPAPTTLHRHRRRRSPQRAGVDPRVR